MKLPITQTASEQLMRAINTEESILFTKIELVGLTTHTITDVRKPADGTAVGVSVIVDKQDLQGNPRFDVLRIYAKVGSGVEFLFATTGITIDFSGDEDRRLILTVYLDITNSEEVTFEYSGGGSAYDVAIAQGFEGTAQEWLDNLKVTVDRYTQDSRGDTVVHFTDGPDVIIETGEAERVSSENARVTAESERISNEEDRQENEQGRESAESERVSNEEERHRHYNGLIDTGIMEENILQKLADAELQYAPRLTKLEHNDADLTAQLAQTANKVEGSVSILNFKPTENDWTSAFQQAIATGRDVYVPRGFEFTIGDVELNDSTVYGGGTIVKKTNSLSAFHVTGIGSKIDGLVFAGEPSVGQPNTDIKLGEGARDVQIINNLFKSPTYSAVAGSDDTLHSGTVYVDRVKGVLITNNIFKGYGRPLHLHSIENITITNNIFRDTGFDAIRLRENDGFCLINSNQFINIGNGNWSDLQTKDAVDTYWGGNTLTITNNIVKGTSYAAFDIKGSRGGSEKSSKVIISNNQIQDTRFNAIHIHGDSETMDVVEEIIISDNNISNCGLNKSATDCNGIHVNGLVNYINIHDNMVFSNFGRGIFVNNPHGGQPNKMVKVTGNMTLNNGGQAGAIPDAGIHIAEVDGLILTDNISGNDETLSNPKQLTGIFFTPTTLGDVHKRAIISRNLVINNISHQIYIDKHLERMDAIAVFSENIQEGAGAFNREYQHQRTILHGTSCPKEGDGKFRKGDIVFNVNAYAGGFVGWVCVDPETFEWKEFGAINS